MMLPVAFKLTNGQPLLVNPMYIITVEEAEEGHCKILVGSAFYLVNHSMEWVSDKLYAAHEEYLRDHKLATS